MGRTKKEFEIKLPQRVEFDARGVARALKGAAGLLKEIREWL